MGISVVEIISIHNDVNNNINFIILSLYIMLWMYITILYYRSLQISIAIYETKNKWIRENVNKYLYYHNVFINKLL